jgi:hypothetical protein
VLNALNCKTGEVIKQGVNGAECVKLLDDCSCPSKLALNYDPGVKSGVVRLYYPETTTCSKYSYKAQNVTVITGYRRMCTISTPNAYGTKTAYVKGVCTKGGGWLTVESSAPRDMPDPGGDSDKCK